MHHNHPFPAPPPSQGNRPGNEVATTTESALIAHEEDEDVHGMDGWNANPKVDNTVWNEEYRGAEITRYGPVFFENTDIPGRTVFQDTRRVHRVSGTVFVPIRT